MPHRIAVSLVALLLAGCAASPPGPAVVLAGKVAAAPIARESQPIQPETVLRDLNGDPNVVEVDLVATEEDVQLLATGNKTRMMLFNGQFPGPALQCKEGDAVIVHFHNHLSSETTVHFHGMVINPEQDGGPWNNVSPGQSHTYRWTARAGMPMTAWYHAHPHGMTHVQAPMGLVGPLRILATEDPLPAAYGDTTLMLTDQKFNLANQILPDTEFDRFNGREGDKVFVNGQLLPKLPMRPGAIARLRFINASPARFYKLAVPGAKLVHVGTDGGLFETPAAVDNLLLASAERAEILVQAPRVPGSYPLKALAHDRGLGLKETFDRTLATIEVAGEPDDPPPIPPALRTVAPISLAGALGRTVKLGAVAAASGLLHFTLDQQTYDPLRIDGKATLGTTEVITVNNSVGSGDHPMHLHNVQFQALDANGTPIPRWKDVVVATRGKLTKFVVRYAADEFPGLFMLHCHILQHEDDGMMTSIFVNGLTPP